MVLGVSLSERARLWLSGDPDELTRAELEALVAADDERGLSACFEPALAFGTAGLRGVVGAGPARMNRAVVRRVAWGLGQFLREEGLAQRVVVVGFDARPSSRRFAEDTREILSAQGIAVCAFAEPTPTPLVAYACRALHAAAGVVVTASHNPREDNGYKVYDDRGMQIVAPWDERIAALMAEAPPANEIPGSEVLVRVVPESLVDAYFAGLERLRASSVPGEPLRVAYTPLHGVGLAPVLRALAPSGVDVRVVENQAEPDGSFPTTPFPNPEEPGTLDALLALAEREDCALALANDPDADRLAVCVPLPHAEAGQRFRLLSGDEVGALLCDHVLSARGSKAGAVVAASIVSSPFIEAVVEAHGARLSRTLTGFKWLCRVADHLAPGEELVFAYEEALGLCVDPARVRDKDGISAAVVTIDLAEQLRARGMTLFERLRELSVRHGLWASAPRSVRLSGAGAERRMADALRTLRGAPPSELAALAVTSVMDFAQGAEARPPYLGAQELLVLSLSGAGALAGVTGRVLVRPSGTEPRLKLYVHLGARLAGPSELERKERELLELGRSVGSALVASLALGEP